MRTTSGAKARRSAGIRDAKAHFSALVDDVRQGREWVITDRGKPVAKLVPIPTAERSLEERLADLEARGIIEPANPNARPLPPPIPVEFGLMQRILQEDRDRT